jgi:energy-coupling factor transporter transmembrane protein EcfT
MEQQATPLPRWDVPEMAAAAVLVGIAVVIAGGVAAGVAVGAAQIGIPPGAAQTVGEDLQVAAQWADLVVAIVLLALSGLCWWQAESWVDAISGGEVEGEDGWAHEHLRRVRALTLGTQIELVLTGIGAVASFVGAVVFDASFPSGSDAWTRDIFPGANLLAVLVVVTVGVLVTRNVALTATTADAGLRTGR